MGRRNEETQPRTGLASRSSFVRDLSAAVIVLLACGASTQTATANTLEVGGGGYSTISAAVHAASPGDTILIHAGTYPEQVNLDKQLTLQPYGDGEVVIDGECTRSYGFLIANSAPGSNPVGVVLRGLTVANTRSASVMFMLDRSDSPKPAQGTVDAMTLRNFQCQGADGNQYHGGVAVYFGGSGFRITNNTIIGPTGFHASADGIWFKSNDGIPSGGGHYIAGNTISNVWDAIGGEEESSAHGTLDKDSIVENNIITRCYDDGINVEGGDQNVIVRNNEVSGCGTGVAFAPAVTGPLYIENNYIHDLILGDYNNLFCFKVGNGSSATAYLTGNICDVDSAAEVSQGGGDGIHQTNEGMLKLVARNNTFRVSRYVYTFGYNNPLNYNSSLDYDCMWTTDSSRFVKWAGAYLLNIDQLREYTGQELNGQQTTDCSFLGTPTPLPALTPPPRTSPSVPPSTPTPTRQTPLAQPTTGPEQTASPDDGFGALTSPIVLGLEAMAGLTLLVLGLIAGVRWFRRRRTPP